MRRGGRGRLESDRGERMGWRSAGGRGGGVEGWVGGQPLVLTCGEFDSSSEPHFPFRPLLLSYWIIRFDQKRPCINSFPVQYFPSSADHCGHLAVNLA